MNHSFKLKNAALVMALAAIYPLHVNAAAGIAQFAVGDVNVRRGQAVAPLSRGQQINSGDNIVTGARGQTQIRFTDGGLVSLAPNSQFNIDKYVDENKPEEDGFFASFLRGGMRAITGLVGKRSRESYKITTTTATIGIRGSAFSANYNQDGSINVAGEQDGIVVCTNAGCVDLIVGEAVKVTDGNSLPQRTSARSNVPPLVARDDLFGSVNPEVIEPPLSDQINGNLAGVSAMFAVGQSRRIDSAPRGGLDPSSGQGTFSNGLMVRHEVFESANGSEMVLSASAITIQGSSSVVEKTGTDTGSFGNVGVAGDPAFIGWGYWETGRQTYSYAQEISATSEDGEDWTEGVHYLVGRPTPHEQMPMSGFARYTLVGGTAPTAFDDYVLRTGTLNGAGLIVDFGSGKLNGYVSTSFVVGGIATPVVITGNGTVSDSRFSGYDQDENGEFYGFFTGAGATRAGLVYQTYHGGLGTIHGAAVLVQGSLERQEGVSAMFMTDNGEGASSLNGGADPSTGIGYFVGNELYIHDGGVESDNGYSGYAALEVSSSSTFAAASPVSSSGASGARGAADFIGWGYWANGSKGSTVGANAISGVHYVVGRPTASNDMPATGVADYTMVGGTAPTSTFDGKPIAGQLTGASLTLDFLRGSGTATVKTVFQPSESPIHMDITNLPISRLGATAKFDGTSTNGKVSGFFSGSLATKAGMVYEMPGQSGLGMVTGAAGLARPAGALAPSQPFAD